MKTMRKMTVHKSHTFRDAAEWDLAQQAAMTPEERCAAARELQRRFYGDRCPDVWESRVVRILRPDRQGSGPKA